MSLVHQGSRWGAGDTEVLQDHDAEAGARSSVPSPEAELLSGLLMCKFGSPFPPPRIQKNHS